MSDEDGVKETLRQRMARLTALRQARPLTYAREVAAGRVTPSEREVIESE